MHTAWAGAAWRARRSHCERLTAENPTFQGYERARDPPCSMLLRQLAGAALVVAAARDPTRAECFLGDLCGTGADRDWLCLQHVPPTCSRLNLGGNGIDNAGAAALAEALRHNTAVKIVKLGHNVIGDAGATALASSLKHNTAVETLFVHAATEPLVMGH